MVEMYSTKQGCEKLEGQNWLGCEKVWNRELKRLGGVETCWAWIWLDPQGIGYIRMRMWKTLHQFWVGV